jgi:threonine 3-dehydrogenase
MRAWRKLRPEPGFDLVDAPAPSCGPTDVVVDVRLAGLCGTDRHIFEWDSWAAGRVPVGITIGHEFMGIVREVGATVDRVRPGDRVSGEGHIGCGECQPCRTGNGHICEHVDILGIDIDGCFADAVVLPAENVWPLPDAVDDRTAALLDPFGNAVHTVTAAGVSGRSVLVTGCGVIGLMAIAVARTVGAGAIIAVDVDDRRLELARAMGADHVMNADDPGWPAAARELTRSQGPEVLLEMSGNPAAIAAGFEALRNGGTAALLGLPSEPVPLDLPNHIIFKGATVLGINGRTMFDTWYRAEELLLSGRVDLAPLVSHELPMERIDKAFELIGNGEALKVLLRVAE